MFDFILIVRLAKENGFFGKENGYGMGGRYGFFLLKTQKMEGTTIKNTPKKRWFLL